MNNDTKPVQDVIFDACVFLLTSALTAAVVLAFFYGSGLIVEAVVRVATGGQK